MKIFTTVFLAVLFIVGNCAAQKPDWLIKLEGVVLLQQTHTDIVELFGEPEQSDYPYYRVFRLKDGRLSAHYSTGFCDEDKKEGWNVPPLTVTALFFVPKKQIKPEKLGFDLTSFSFSEIFDVPNAFIASNDELGIEFVKTTKGRVETVSFYPANKFDHLYCEE